MTNAFPVPNTIGKRARYLPVYPQKPLVPGGIQLLLANGVEMTQLGYVCTGRIYTVHISMLRSYYWGFAANHFRLCKQSLAHVLLHHSGLTIMVDTATPMLGQSFDAMLRQARVDNNIHALWQYTRRKTDRLLGQRTGSYLESLPTHRELIPVYHASYHRAPLPSQAHICGSYKTLPRYTPRNVYATPTSARLRRSSTTVLGSLGRIARNTGSMLSGPARSSLQLLHRKYGIILFLLATFAVGVGAVYGTIWVVNFVCPSRAAAVHWVAGEWQLL